MEKVEDFIAIDYNNVAANKPTASEGNSRRPQKIREIPNSSSLTLQMLLFTNVHLFPFWVASSLYYFYTHSFASGGRHENTLGAIFFVIASPLEVSRLYLAYSGNLREKIADFAGFLILSAFIQQPIQIYFVYLIHKTKAFWLQFVIQIVLTILILMQLVVGYNAMRRMTKLKAQQFHIQTLIDQCNKKQQTE